MKALPAGGRLEPRKVVGSVDAGKALVAVAASLGLLFYSVRAQSKEKAAGSGSGDRQPVGA
ncbi:hypothetical protein [Streptomyces sp. NPDC051636]|uniref:hypothetical protein n=1 Tax=Streptomyces sp. NPDC051636 TaxID=3365663 RepID=UPI003788A75D